MATASPDVDAIAISLYAKGIDHGRDHRALSEVYGASICKDTISVFAGGLLSIAAATRGAG